MTNKGRVTAGVMVVALAVGGLIVLYAIYSGGAVSRVRVPGLFDVTLSEKSKPPPVASREFVLGGWQVEQDYGNSHSYANYLGDGTCTFKFDKFVGVDGRREAAACRWNFEKLSDKRFRLTGEYTFRDGIKEKWDSTFDIVDGNRVHSVNGNFDSVRQ